VGHSLGDTHGTLTAWDTHCDAHEELGGQARLMMHHQPWDKKWERSKPRTRHALRGTLVVGVPIRHVLQAGLGALGRSSNKGRRWSECLDGDVTCQAPVAEPPPTVRHVRHAAAPGCDRRGAGLVHACRASARIRGPLLDGLLLPGVGGPVQCYWTGYC
jgi:hypothetical protein